MPALSTRYVTWPALAFFTAVATSGVTVPTFGFGMRPRGPEDLAELADDAHGVRAGDHDVEIDLAGLDLLGQVFDADDVGARGLRRSAFLPAVNTATRTVLPVPCGITVEPRTCWSDFWRRCRDSRRHRRTR